MSFANPFTRLLKAKIYIYIYIIILHIMLRFHYNASDVEFVQTKDMC